MKKQIILKHVRKINFKKSTNQEEKMKKFWILLLSIGFIIAFTMPAAAVDVKFNGSYTVQGNYEDNSTLSDPHGGLSYVWQRLRVGTTFRVEDGLTLTTRFDALEKIWGAPRTAYNPASVTNPTGTGYSSTNPTPYAVTDAENIQFQHAYVTLNSLIGVFNVGYMTQGTWGTAFGDTGEQDYGARIKWDLTTGPFTWGARWDKVEGPKVPAFIEHDYEKYSVLGVYKWSKGDAGLQITYYLSSANADDTSAGKGYRAKYWQFQPYAKAKLGPVYIEGELGFLTGRDREYIIETAANPNRDISGWRGYLMANVDLAPAYIGAVVFYASGDDINTPKKNEGGAKIGTDFSPCLILVNYDLTKWNNAALGSRLTTGGVGANGITAGSNVDNILAYQVYGGIKPMPKLDIKASVTSASLDQNAVANQISKSIGNEFDVTATYKIYDNLSYMVGFGYLWAGDAFKGANTAAKINDDYLLTHKLTLNF
jgi:hypothetical protein